MLKKTVAEDMISALDRFREFLFKNEYDKIVECILYYIDEPVVAEDKPEHATDQPPLRAIWYYIWDKKISLSIASLILLVIVSFGLGHYVWV